MEPPRSAAVGPAAAGPAAAGPAAEPRAHGLRLDALSSMVPSCRDHFVSAAPWPHIVVDDLVDPDLAARAEEQEAAFASRLRPHRSHREVKAESTVPDGPAARAILHDLLSPEFVAFLEAMTGISRLIGDPGHFHGGLHVSAPGSFQSVHTDFERHHQPDLYHRVNALVYLNSDWPAEYGGQLELWPEDMSACGRRIEPVLGRMVIFTTGPSTRHGVPDPITCPPGRYRLSLASYYYTREQPQLQRFRDRLLQSQRPQDPWIRRLVGPSNAVGALRRVSQRWHHR